MGHVSGRDGDLSLAGAELAHVVGWSIDWTVDTFKGAHSDSDNWKETVAGNMEWGGSVTVEADEGGIPAALEAAIIAGAEVAFDGEAYTGNHYTGQVVLGGATNIGAAVQGGEVEEITYPFEGSGVLTIPNP